ncbi:hypothetical protein B0H14DRAFT_2402906, partial [Mycena olivaceomarginata]
ILCSRWAVLGAFYPFMCNKDHCAHVFIQHNSDTSISQEFHRGSYHSGCAECTGYSVCRKCLGLPLMAYSSIPNCLLDYFYTAFHDASLQGTPAPLISPLWFKYPKDTAISH